MKSKLISMVLVFLLSAGGFVGCTSNTPSLSVPTDSSTPLQESKTQQTDTPAVEKIVIFQNSGVISASGKAGSNAQDLKLVHDYILDSCGIDVEVIVPPAGADAKEKLNAMLASQQELDLFWGSRTEYKDIIQPLNAAYDNYGSAIKELWPEETFLGITDKDGTIWATPRGAHTAPYPLHLRTDWLKTVGMSYPSTIDELEAVLEAFKEQDPAGDGKTIPLGADLTGLNNALSAGFTGVGYGRFLDEADGKLKHTVLHPGYKDFVEKMADWYGKGYIYAEAFTTDRNRYNELIKLGNFGGFAYWYSLISIISPQLTAQQPEAVYEYHRPLSGPAGPAETHGSVGASGGVVPKYSEKANTVVRYVNWICEEPENFLNVWKGQENKHWKYVDKENKVIEIIDTDSYLGDFIGSLGTPVETLFSLNDQSSALHDSWLRTKLFEFDGTVGQTGWDLVFDEIAISDKVAEKGDIDRMISEEVVKFITNVTPMSQWEDFIESLHNIGIDKLNDAYTEQYADLK